MTPNKGQERFPIPISGVYYVVSLYGFLFGVGMNFGTLQRENAQNLTIRKKFNTRRFADYKERVIELLRRASDR